MRTIKFRGKRVDGGGWITGYYVKELNPYIKDTEEIDAIITKAGDYEVLPESVGQWTGLVDWHGKEVFEGDILHRHGHQNMFIEFYKGAFCLVSCNPVQRANWSPVTCRGSDTRYRAIIGNIHDNPEMMEV